MLQLVFAHNARNLVSEMQLELLQTVFFQFLLSRQRRFCFQLINQPVVFAMLHHQRTESLIRLHQMRFEFCLRVLIHFSAFLLISGVASPDQRTLLAG